MSDIHMQGHYESAQKSIMSPPEMSTDRWVLASHPEGHDPDIGSQSIRPLSRLDPDERLPREESLAPERGGLQLQREPTGWRRLNRAELAAVVAVPALVVLGVALGRSGAPPVVGVMCIALLILALVAFAVSGRRPKK